MLPSAIPSLHGSLHLPPDPAGPRHRTELLNLSRTSHVSRYRDDTDHLNLLTGTVKPVDNDKRQSAYLPFECMACETPAAPLSLALPSVQSRRGMIVPRLYLDRFFTMTARIKIPRVVTGDHDVSSCRSVFPWRYVDRRTNRATSKRTIAPIAAIMTSRGRMPGVRKRWPATTAPSIPMTTSSTTP